MALGVSDDSSAAAVRVDDRALWATALYAGLRSGELRALQWQHVRLGAGVIEVRQAMDDKGAVTPPKTRAGVRTVPIAPPLRDALTRLKAARCILAIDDAFVFGSDPTRPDAPFTPTAIYKRALKAWGASDPPCMPIRLHEARHSCASMWIDAGLDPKKLSARLGHASITITYDRYGHLFPSADEADAVLIAAYFERADTASRVAQLDRRDS